MLQSMWRASSHGRKAYTGLVGRNRRSGRCSLDAGSRCRTLGRLSSYQTLTRNESIKGMVARLANHRSPGLVVKVPVGGSLPDRSYTGLRVQGTLHVRHSGRHHQDWRSVGPQKHSTSSSRHSWLPNQSPRPSNICQSEVGGGVTTDNGQGPSCGCQNEEH